MLRKKWGHIGDSPIIGAGTYADNNSCAISCTGHGEYFIRHVVAYNLCARYKYLNETIEEAANHIIHNELNPDAGNGGLIAVDKDGYITITYNSQGMFRGFLYKEKGNPVAKKILSNSSFSKASSLLLDYSACRKILVGCLQI